MANYKPALRVERKTGKKFTRSFLRSIISYNPRKGKFIWREGKLKGREAGSRGGKYVQINICNTTLIAAHILAFFYMTGRWPKAQIDHRNKNKRDNRWSNLREATNGQNLFNRGKTKANTSGFKGVYKNTRGWMSQIKEHGRLHYLGTFPTKQKAYTVYKIAAKKFHGDFAHG